MPVHFGHDLGRGDIVLAAKRADNFGIDGGIASQGGKKPPPGLSIGLVRGHCHLSVTHRKLRHQNLLRGQRADAGASTARLDCKLTTTSPQPCTPSSSQANGIA